MSLPKIAGIETEYGILIRGVENSSPFLASQILLQSCLEPKVSNRSQVVALEDDFMLANGSRFYIDHAHPEYCTPESRFPKDVVAADKAGEKILDRCCQQVNSNGALSPGQEISIYKNNSDQKGNSYGCHENYLLSANLYEALIYGQSLTLSKLVPFLVTRSLLCGSGKVGSENGTAPITFQLTQRADFFETLFGIQTTHHRPIINTRDEAHAERTYYRRLHVIVGDANLSEYSTYLKVGTTQLVLMMLEDGTLDVDLTLKDAIAAIQTVSRDLTFSEKLALDNGTQASAIDIQQEYLRQAKHYVETLEHPQAWQEVIELWQNTLDQLIQNWQSLSARLDWAIKRNLLERYLHTQKSDWDTINLWEPLIQATLNLQGVESVDLLSALRTHVPTASELESYAQTHHLDWDDYWHQRNVYFTLRRLDLDYHDIAQGSGAQKMGLFYRLQQQGLIERLLTPNDIDRFVTTPPLDTRAYLRGYLIQEYADTIQQINWGEIEFYETELKQSYHLILPDLMKGTQTELQALLNSPRLPIGELLKSLAPTTNTSQLNHGPTTSNSSPTLIPETPNSLPGKLDSTEPSPPG